VGRKGRKYWAVVAQKFLKCSIKLYVQTKQLDKMSKT